MKALLCFSIFLLPAVLGAHVDLSTYPLSQVLRDEGGETYTLHWGFNVEQETIRFAVNVSTLGWVGLGLSPTGGMANSDVVIGWVNSNGQAFLDDRFATGESRPPVDAQQNWSLDGGEEDNGYTILAFSRDWVTCDEKDRDILTDTTRMIFSWNEADPANDDSSLVFYHGDTNRGTTNVNLLGGQQEVPPDPADLQSFDLTVTNLDVPNADTTYWCYAQTIPQTLQDQTHYVTKISPVITAGNELNVHHILVYACSDAGLTNAHNGFGISCDSSDPMATPLRRCRGSTLIFGWAIGGTDFVFPADVAYPLGGNGNPQFLVMEVHYDNPDRLSNIVDSSGITFSYTATQRTYDAGILEVGRRVEQFMVVPPGASNFLQFGECSSDCTSRHIPQGGINIFANTLHTHLVGISLTVHHLRRASSGPCANQWQELKPIDQNLQYDFNYQQANYLPQIVNVQRGDIIRLQCNYNTTNRTGVVLGGESTFEEMCLTFLNYYPRVNLAQCLTNVPIVQGSYEPWFSSDHLNDTLRTNILAAISGTQAQFKASLNAVSWSSAAIESFQSSIDNGPLTDACRASTGNTEIQYTSGLPQASAQCRYTAPDPCSPTDFPGDGAPTLSASISVVIAVALVALAMFK